MSYWTGTHRPLDIEATLKAEFYGLKQVEMDIMNRINIEKNPDNIVTLTNGLEYVRNTMKECAKDMEYFGIKVGNDK